MLKRILLLLLAAIIALGVVVIVRTGFASAPLKRGTDYQFMPDADRLAQQMSTAVQIKTVSYGRDQPVEARAFHELHDFLEAQFPLVHAYIKRERVNNYSLLYHWRGSEPEQGKPILLLGHLDVVPAAEGADSEWVHPPFAGKIVDGFIWGRGTLDNKINIISILSAAEYMLEQGLRPKRDVYFAFGHDEEVGGVEGAGEMAKLLKARGLSFEFTLDEGGSLTRGLVAGVESPVAIIAPGEKGYVDVHLSTRSSGGHSAWPPEQTAIGILAAAIARLEANQFPRNFKYMQYFLEGIADGLPFMQRLLAKNLWLFKPLVMWQRNRPTEQAAMRTTIATTIIRGGTKANILPSKAEAVVNFRILPGETPETVLAHVIEAIDDVRVKIELDSLQFTPSPMLSPASGYGWEKLTDAIRDIADEGVLIAPRLLIAATDSRHYLRVSDKQYRFTWIEVDKSNRGVIHGKNERISASNLVQAVRFFHRFLSAL